MADITTKGPIFDGQAVKVIGQYIQAATEEVADEGVDLVRQRLGSVLKRPTGFYRSRITTDRASKDRVIVTDGGVVYGPWLEGTGSRNSTSRFKGYRTFRQTVQALDARAEALAEASLSPYMRRLS